MIVKCKNCGKEFLTYPSRVKKGYAKFCSRKCQAVWKSLNQSGENSPITGRHLSDETKMKMRKARIKNPIKYWEGKYMPERTKEKISRTLKGRHLTFEWKRKIAEGERGKQIPSEIRLQISRSLKGNKNCLGRHLSRETREKIKRNHANFKGNNHPNWRGGISKKPYPFDFNEELKEFIRKRDNYKCQLCGCPEIENAEKLSIHHIDYNKNNLKSENLISLCRNCNAKVNFNRNYWKNHFMNLTESLEGAEANA